MGYSTHSQGLGAFKSNMAAHFGHARILQKNSAFLRDLETCNELESTQISFGELRSYAKLFYYYRVARKIDLFMRKRKEEAYSSHVYGDTKSGDKQLRP